MSSALIDNGSSCNSKVRESFPFFYSVWTVCAGLEPEELQIYFSDTLSHIPEAVESRTHGACDFFIGDVRDITKGVTIHAGRIYSHLRGPVLR